MKVLVLNGSPKGKYSITLHTSLYLEKHFPGHEFSYLNVGRDIRAMEKDFSAAADAVLGADLIIFSYPVYTFIAPSQLHRFIELLKASGIDVSGKFAAQITTSKHFYDVTAHEFIRQNCQDLGMKYINGLSADMDDLLTEEGQKHAREFFEFVCWCVEHDVYETIPKPAEAPAYLPVSAAVPDEEGKTGDVVVVTDCGKDDRQLGDMINRFRAVLRHKSRVVNISEYPFQDGCLGCFNCAATGKCVYRDGFDNFLRDGIQTADAIVYAFKIKDHSMGPVFKIYDDRQFCNGHRTVTMGKPVGYLVSGNYPAEANLKLIIEGRSEVGGNFLAGVACDQTDPDTEIDRLAARLDYAVSHRYAQPRNFYGVGGMKIFRDLIWEMRGLMKADHRFYREHGLYDFPQKRKGTIVKMYLVGALMSSSRLRSKIGNRFLEGMIEPYRKVVEK
ncbi:MAG: iron-sulfur protein [Clostridiaceae bacterium]|nr:iron-sulfur protein [Clostridiaceae bacterium]HPU45054.1 NAD(P)H-dependent oxidoreductase [Thermoclostridium sp.]